MIYEGKIEFDINGQEAVVAEALARPYTDPTWRKSFYDLDHEDAVLDHLCWNVVANHVTDISQLDGWADIPKGAVTFDWRGW